MANLSVGIIIILFFLCVVIVYHVYDRHDK